MGDWEHSGERHVDGSNDLMSACTCHVRRISELEREIDRLEAALKKLKRKHRYEYPACHATGGSGCTCGADKHNARIDAVLRGAK